MLLVASSAITIEQKAVDERGGGRRIAGRSAQRCRNGLEEQLGVTEMRVGQSANVRHDAGGLERDPRLDDRRRQVGLGGFHSSGGFIRGVTRAFAEACGGETLTCHVDDLRRLEQLAITTRIDGAYAFVERRMGGPQPGQAGAKCLGEEEMSDLAGVVVDDVAAERVATDFLEGAGDAV